MSKSKIKVAYQVNEDCEGCSVIVFHNHALAARRLGAEHLGEDFESVTCFRAPHFDSFANQGFVPVIARLEVGWWFECPNCRKRVSEDDCELQLVVTEKDNAFCNQQCFDNYKNQITNHNKDFEQTCLHVQKLRPDLQFIKFTGLWPQLTFIAEFKFDGCQYGGSARKDRSEDGFQWYVANGDKEAWEIYDAKIKSSHPD